MRKPPILIAAFVSILTVANPALAHPPGPDGRPGGAGEVRPGPPMHGPMMLNPVMRLGFELPTLKLDLRLRTEQLAAWEKLELALRSMAPPGRAEGERPWPRPSESPPTALEILNREAAILKSLSGKIDAVAAAMAELYANLDTEQRGLLDRRLGPPRSR